MKSLLVEMAIMLVFVSVPCEAHTPTPHYTLTLTCRPQYLNKPGIGVYKNAHCFTEFIAKYREVEAGIELFKGLSIRNFDDHSLGNEIDFFLGWSHKFEYVETHFRLSYFMNDFPPPRGGIDMATDDQWIVDAEVLYHKLSWFQPYVAYRYFGCIGAGCPKPGSFWWLGLKKKWSFSFLDKGMAFLIDIQGAFSDGALGPAGKDAGFAYGRLTLHHETKWGNVTFLPHIIYQGAESYGGLLDYAERQHVFVYGLTLKYDF